MEKRVKISNGIVTAEISTLGAELKSITKNNKEVLWQGDPNVWEDQAPILFPICGQLKDGKYVYDGKEYKLQGHGFAHVSEFKHEKTTDTSATFLLCSDANTLKVYPFQFELRVTYTIDDTSINVKYSVSNKSDGEMYFSIGSHEGYACPEGIEEYSLVFETPEDLIFNGLDLPLLNYKEYSFGEGVKELPLKYEYFDIDTLAFLKLKSRKVSLKHMASGELRTVDFADFPYLYVWTEKDAKFVCIEPWCGMPDFIDSNYDFKNKKGCIRLEKDGTFECNHKITI